MDAKELELTKRWVEQWRITGQLLDEMKTRELREMSEEEGRRRAEDLLSAAPDPQDWSPAPHTSGLVEQQRWFMKMREKL